MQPLLFAFSLALVASPQIEDAGDTTYTWTPYTTVVEMTPAMGGWTWANVALGKVNCGASKATNLQLTTSGVDGALATARDRIYVTLRGAMFAGKEVSFRVRRHIDPTNDWCVIERVTVKP